MSRSKVVLKTVAGAGVFLIALPAMAHIRYLDLDQNKRIRELTPAGIALVGNNVPISDPAYWTATYQTAQASTEVWGAVTGSYQSGNWSTSVQVSNIDASGWTDGLRTDPDGGAYVLADSHTLGYANFHLKYGAHVSITLADNKAGSGEGLNPSFSLYASPGVYGGHDDAALDPKNPTAGTPPVKIQNALDDGTALDWKGNLSPLRNTLTNTGTYQGQVNVTGDFSLADSAGHWSVMKYVTSVTGAVNPDGSWLGNANENSLTNYYLPPGDYVIVFGGNPQLPSYATARSAETTSTRGLATGQVATLSLAVAMVDTDGDGVGDTGDAYPDNPAEAYDTDLDGTGNHADLDDDNDGVPDTADALPLDATETLDNDGDGLGDNADTDDDNDTVADAQDNCPMLANTNQLDFDEDGTGDACGDPAPLPAALAGAAARDAAGTAVAFAGDFNGDGYGDYVVGTPGFDAAPVAGSKPLKDAGKADVISGRDGTVLFTMAGESTKDGFGTAVAGNGDVDGDGYDDVVVGAPLADDVMHGVKDAGVLRVIYGPAGDRWRGMYGATAKAGFGSSVALGDADNDGHADVIVGSPKDDNLADGLVDAGRVAVYSGSDFAVLATFHGSAAKAYAGSSVAAGDVNHDGKADIVVGAPGDDDVAGGLKHAGSVTVYAASGDTLLQAFGTSVKSLFGTAVAAADVDGDGKDDVLVGAPADDGDGKALKDAGSITLLSAADATVIVKKTGSTGKAALGSSVALGDVDGDGHADLLAGAPKDDAPDARNRRDAGSVGVWHSNGDKLIGVLYGTAAKDAFGTALATGDINSDGQLDVIIGIAGKDAAAGKGQKDTGAVQTVSAGDF